MQRQKPELQQQRWSRRRLEVVRQMQRALPVLLPVR
jgi:hypothetical protein